MDYEPIPDHNCCAYMDGDKHAVVKEENCCFDSVIVEFKIPADLAVILTTMSEEEGKLFLEFIEELAPIIADHDGDIVAAMGDFRTKDLYEKHRNRPEIKRLRGAKYS